MRVLAWPLKTRLNPYTGLVFSNLGPEVAVDEWPGNPLRKYDVWHAHWPDALLGIPNTPHCAFKLAGMFAQMDYMRLRGTRIVWTIHNLASHEARHPQLESWFWRNFVPRVDGAISLSAAGLEMALDRYSGLKNVPTTVIPHGHYRQQYPPASGSSRAILGISQRAKVILFFGAVRAYKNVETLVEAFREVTRDDVLLYIVGQPNSKTLTERIADLARQDARVTLKFEFARAEDVPTYLGAADLVVLPYREVLNSGSAMLALSCNRPVLVPRRGAMGELQAEFSDQWVRTFEGRIDATLLDSALDWALQTSRPAQCPIPEKFNWGQIGSATTQFYRRTIESIAARDAKMHVVRINDGGTSA